MWIRKAEEPESIFDLVIHLEYPEDFKAGTSVDDAYNDVDSAEIELKKVLERLVGKKLSSKIKIQNVDYFDNDGNIEEPLIYFSVLIKGPEYIIDTVSTKLEEKKNARL